MPSAASIQPSPAVPSAALPISGTTQLSPLHHPGLFAGSISPTFAAALGSGMVQSVLSGVTLLPPVRQSSMSIDVDAPTLVPTWVGS